MDPLLPPVFLLAYFVAFFAFAFVWRSLRVWRRTGVNPVVLPAGDDAYAYVGRAFKLVMVGCGVVAALPVLAADAPRWLGAWTALASVPAAVCGWLLLVVALFWLLVAQAQMGASWRIGIDSARAHRAGAARAVRALAQPDLPRPCAWNCSASSSCCPVPQAPRCWSPARS